MDVEEQAYIQGERAAAASFMINIKIGQILLIKYNGAHSYSRLVVLHDRKTTQRILYDIDNGVRVGYIHALYSKVTTERLTSAEIESVSKKLGID